MKIIPQFSLEDAESIGLALDAAGIPYEQRGVVTSVGRSGGNPVFVMCVSDEHLKAAVQIIKDLYGFLDNPPGPVSGICPACNTEVHRVLECPECGLTLSFNPRDLMRKHPFSVFLDQLEAGGS
jgi:rubredoxin